MSIFEYSEDVSKTLEEIMALCDKLQIAYTDQNSMLSDDDITLLDNEIRILGEEDPESEEAFDEELEEKVEKIVTESNLENDRPVKKNKVKKQINSQEKKKAFEEEKKAMYKHREKLQSNEQVADENVILYKEGMSVADVANLLSVPTTEILKKLMGLGVMATLNQSLSFEVVELLVVDYNKELKREGTQDIADFENFEITEKEEDLITRPPVVTIMGHVDHGKTSLLDYIRKAHVVSGEAGGITQAIGAYQVHYNDRLITFIDTPGHEAFTEMRARGASVTDIVIIIVAADDGVMPQTKEAIDHAKAAGVPILVAINKMDKPDANPDRVLTELVENGLTPEEWGGDIIVSKISAATGMGVDELLENILLVSDMQELKANPSRYASGAVLESRMDKQVGTVASLLIQNGTLRLGDPIVVGCAYGKVRTLKNDQGQDIVEALPSTPVEVTGLSETPSAGDKFMAFETEKKAKQISEERRIRSKAQDTNKSGMTLEDLFGQIHEGLKEINVVLKCDVNGSAEAVKNSLEKIDVEGVKINVIRSGVGTISESDIVLASASHAIVIGFNVRPTSKTVEAAKQAGVDIRLYDIIYKVVEDMEAAMKGMLEPLYEEKVLGEAEIRQLFHFSKVGTIAGCHVTSGTIKSNSNARIVRDGVVVYTGKLKSLQREKDQVKEVKKDMDCGLTLENFQDYKEKDVVEAYELIEIKR